MPVHAHAVAWLEILHLVADREHRPGGLVPQDHRLFDDEGTDATSFIVMDVAAAHADRVQLDAHVVRSKLFLDLNVAQIQDFCFFKNEGLHG